MSFLIVNALVLLAQQSTTSGELTARINPSVELLSIVFRLAKNPEYNMSSSKSPYADEVEKHFGKFRDHAVVQLAQKLRGEHGVSFDAVMSMAVHLDTKVSGAGDSGQVEIKPKAGLGSKPARLDQRWDADDAKEFLSKLRDFARESDFAGFFTAHQAFYKNAAAQLTAALAKRNPVAWFDRFFGIRPGAKFDLSVGLLNGGGCYGVSVAFENGREEICPVIGAGKFKPDGLPDFDEGIEDTVVHELAHTYTNTFVDQFAGKLQSAGEKLFAGSAEKMQRQAYGNWKTLMYESLVRATTLRYIKANRDAAAADKGARKEAQRGFEWVGKLADLMGDYEADRTKYAKFADFMPRVVDFFDGYAAGYAALAAEREKAAEAAEAAAAKGSEPSGNAKRSEPGGNAKDSKPSGNAPRIVKIVPANGAQDVDPDLTEIVITFDRRMIDGNWSVVGGGPHFPETVGKPSYDSSRKVLTLKVRLKPDWEYEFWLNRGKFNSFMSEDGARLPDTRVTFKTRSK